MRRAAILLSISLPALLSLALAGCGGTDSVGFLQSQSETPSDEAPESDRPPVVVPMPDAGASVSNPTPSRKPMSDRPEDGGVSEPFTDGTDEDFCAPTDTGQPGKAGCTTTSLTAAVFPHAVCTCEGIQGTGYLSTRSLSSDPLAAPVGLNGRMGLMIGHLAFPNQEPGRVDGDIIVASEASSVVTGVAGTQPFIRGDLRLGGLLLFGGNVHVGGSVWSATMPLGLGRLRVDEDLHLANGASTPQSPSIVDIGGETHTGPYAVEPPCPCGAAAPVDIANVVADAASGHDNGLVGLASDDLAGVTGNPQLELPCGQYFLEGVDIAGNLELGLSGRTAIYIEGDMTVEGDVLVSLEPGATLDLFVTGDLQVTGAARFAQPERPAASRIYVGNALALESNQDPTDLAQPQNAVGDVVVVGNFYAPRASFLLSPNTDIYGSLFVRTFDVVQGVKIHHDPAVATQEACDARP